MKKRMVSFILIFAIATFTFTPSTLANTGTTENDFANAAKAIATSCEKLEDDVDLSEYKIDKSRYAEFCEYVFDNHPECFYIELGRYSYNPDTSKVVNAIISYKFPKADIPKMIERFNAKTKKILSDMPSNITDVEKMLYFHDYIASNNSYVLEVYENVDLSNNKYIFNAYGCLVNNRSVCEGISEAFIHLCKQVGIKAYAVRSLKMGHEWNMVKYGKNYYHIDVTQDAVVYKLKGTNNSTSYHQASGDITHTFFMKSDSQISDEALGGAAHYSWTAPYKATDETTFNNAFWDTASGKVNYLNGGYYFIKSGKLVRHNYTTGNYKTIYQLEEDTWKCTTKHNHKWKPSSSKAIFNMKNEIYFISNNDVLSYDANTNKITKVFERNGYGFIYCLAYKNDSLILSLRDYDNTSTPFYDDIVLKKFASEESIIGDVNNDLAVDTKDVNILMKYLYKAEKYTIDLKEADVNSDGAVDIKDILFLRLKLAEKIK